AGCHLLVADEAASAVETAERKVRNERILVPGWIVLVESWDDVEPFKQLCDELSGDEAFEDATTTPELGIYRLQNSRAQFPWSSGCFALGVAPSTPNRSTRSRPMIVRLLIASAMQWSTNSKARTPRRRA